MKKELRMEHRKPEEGVQGMKQLLLDRRLKNVTCLIHLSKAEKLLDCCLLLSKKVFLGISVANKKKKK